MAIFGRAKDQEAPQRAAIPDEPQAESGPGEPRSVVDERAFLLENTPEPRPFGLGLLDVEGLTLSENLVSDIDLPVYTAAQTAGWAVRAANLVGATPERPISLPVVASIPASGPIGDALIPGTAVAVEQGSPVPDGADAVIPAELGIPIEDGVSFPQEAGWPTNIVKIGSRIEDGDDLMAAGTELNPRQIAKLAEVGLDKVLAMPKPRIAIGSLGEGLIPPGTPITRLNHRYDAVTPMIAAAIRELGCHAVPIGILPTEYEPLKAELLAHTSTADLILISAPPSELLSKALGELGQVQPQDVAMEPAGPSAFATIGAEGVPVLVLSPDIVAAYISFQVFAIPMILKLSGADPLEREVVAVPSGKPIDAQGQNTRFFLAKLNSEKDEVTALDLPEDAGGVELAAADALIVLAPGLRLLEKQNALVWPFDWVTLRTGFAHLKARIS